MQETKRMHDVPQTYLKPFSTEFIKPGGKKSYLISGLSVSNLIETEIRSMSIKDVCVENDIYALPGATKEERQFLETMYCQLYESDYNKIYQILTDDSKVSVTPGERNEIISFVVSMFYRNSIWGNGHNKLMKETYAKVFALSEAGGKDSFFMEDKEISIAGKTLNEFQKEQWDLDRPAIAVTLAKKIFELARLRRLNDVVTVVTLKDDSFEFITSDNPVSYRNQIGQRPIPFDPTNTLSMPIDSKHLLQLRPWGDQLDKLMLGRMSESAIIGRATTLTNNHFQSIQAERFVFGSATGLKKFIKDKEKYQ